MPKMVVVESAAKARNTRFSETWLYRLDRFASQTIKAAESRLREVSGMSFSQFLVLMAIIEHGDSKQSVIADYVGVTPAVITKQVEALAARGWLHLGPALGDRRANVVRLTEDGKRAARSGLKALDEVMTAELKLASHYQAKLKRVLKQL